MIKEETKFQGGTRDERWPAVLAHYASIEYLDCDPLDEFITLARQLIKKSDGERVEKAKVELEKALNLMEQGNRVEASYQAVKSYQILYYPP